VLKDDKEKDVSQKIKFLYVVLEECLNTDHMKSLAHPYGEDADIAYFELKKRSLAFTMEQLSCDVMIQYRMLPIKHPGKWNDKMFNVVLHWYERIKEYMWLKLIGLPPTQSLCLMQSAVDYVISLEYMQQIDHGEHMYGKDSSTYIDVLPESNPTCSPHRKMAPSCDCKKAHYNVGTHDPKPNWSVCKPYHGTIPTEETSTILQGPVCCSKIE
jgi:hypothetical protein